MFDHFAELHPSHNLKLVGLYLESLDSSSPSFRYAKGEEVYTPNLFNKIKIFFNMPFYTQELYQFYPYHERITTQKKEYDRDLSQAWKDGMVASAVSVFSIFQLARRGNVLPFLSQYGRFFKTHRILRHYIWALILPTTLFQAYVNYSHFRNVEQLWAVHARRMQEGNMNDPAGTQYPDGLLSLNLKSSWCSPFVSDYDKPRKLRNEVDLVDCPDYENPDFEVVDLPQAEAGEQDEEEGEDEE